MASAVQRDFACRDEDRPCGLGHTVEFFMLLGMVCSQKARGEPELGCEKMKGLYIVGGTMGVGKTAVC